MEKKTIGGFIAALRKANGMTQRELAERLNVSDKTVSRWERDDGYPDLAAIPAIAEIFGVTCDELLRGERRSPARREELVESGEETTPKGDKERRRILKTTLSQYKTRSFISAGIAALGLIAALICSFAFYRMRLGFLIGLAFFIAAAVCQAVFVNKAMLSVDDDAFDESELSQFRRSVIGIAKKVYGLTVVLTGLSFHCCPEFYISQSVIISPFVWRIFWAAAALFVYAVVLYFVNPRLIASGKLVLGDEGESVWRSNHRLKKICAMILIPVLIITLILHRASTNLWGPFSIAESIRFDDYESFIEFMEKDVPYEYRNQFGANEQIPQEVTDYSPVTWYDENGYVADQKWYDKYGNEVSEDEANTYTLKDSNDEAVCIFVKRNYSVVSWSYSPKDGSVLPIHVVTRDSMAEAKEKAETRNSVFSMAYVCEAAAAVAAYFIIRKKPIK